MDSITNIIFSIAYTAITLFITAFCCGEAIREGQERGASIPALVGAVATTALICLVWPLATIGASLVRGKE